MNDKLPPIGPAAELVQKLVETARSAMPETVSNDIKQNVKAAIQDVIADLDVVSREEFDTQSRVLAKTRGKVEELEALVDELERRLDQT